MSVQLYSLTVEGDQIRVTAVRTGRSKAMMATNPQMVIDLIGPIVHAKSLMQVLRIISAMDADRLEKDVVVGQFAELAGRSTATICEGIERHLIPSHPVLEAWMNWQPIDDFYRRQIVFYLLFCRAETSDEMEQLRSEFHDVLWF